MTHQSRILLILYPLTFYDIQDYEERHYPSCTVVATKLKARNRKSSGIVERYLRLRNYFRGENAAGMKLTTY